MTTKRNLFAELKDGIDALRMERDGCASLKRIQVTPFDAAEYLADEETIASYLKSAEESGDPEVLRRALDDISRARSARN